VSVLTIGRAHAWLCYVTYILAYYVEQIGSPIRQHINCISALRKCIWLSQCVSVRVKRLLFYDQEG
jgi:hypothetical protein